jgi:hypothetical protein
MRLLFLLLFPFSLTAQKSTVGSSIATDFINSLDSAQRAQSAFDFGQTSRYNWHYLPPSTAFRDGIAIKDLDSIQKQHIHALLEYFLSDKGYKRAKDIMSYEYLLKQLEPNNSSRVPENYFVAFYGSPGRGNTWGFKFSGHHIALNFTIVNDQLAFAPFFFGANPAEIKDGAHKGKRILKEEEDLGFELLNLLTQKQKIIAVFQLKTFTDIVTTNSTQVAPLKPVGIVAKDMTDKQKHVLNKLIAVYLSSMPNEIATIRMKRISLEDLDEIRFGWAGALTPGKPHYYRIQGKTFLIEFDNTQNNANHIHTVWRDFDGDFGIDLLKKHYQNSKHGPK